MLFFRSVTFPHAVSFRFRQAAGRAVTVIRSERMTRWKLIQVGISAHRSVSLFFFWCRHLVVGRQNHLLMSDQQTRWLGNSVAPGTSRRYQLPCGLAHCIAGDGNAYLR